MVIPFSLVPIVLESHEADGKESQCQDDSANEAWPVESEVEKTVIIDHCYKIIGINRRQCYKSRQLSCYCHMFFSPSGLSQQFLIL